MWRTSKMFHVSIFNWTKSFSHTNHFRFDCVMNSPHFLYWKLLNHLPNIEMQNEFNFNESLSEKNYLLPNRKFRSTSGWESGEKISKNSMQLSNLIEVFRVWIKVIYDLWNLKSLKIHFHRNSKRFHIQSSSKTLKRHKMVREILQSINLNNLNWWTPYITIGLNHVMLLLYFYVTK